MSNVIPEEDIRKFYRLLRHQKETEIRTVGLEGARSYFVHGEEEFTNKCLELDGKTNIYAGVQERTNGGTTIKNVKTLRLIPYDFDPIREVGKAASEESRTNASTAAFIFWNALRSEFQNVSLVVSGDGYHIYLPLEDIEIEESNREQIGKAYKFVAKNLLEKYPPPPFAKLDNIWDLSRIMRIPGTLNLRTNLRASFLNYSPSPNVELRKQILDVKVEEPKVEFAPITKIVHSAELAKWIDVDLSRVLNGNFKGFPSRSEAEMSAVCRLVSLGFTDNEIDTIMRAHGMEKWSTANPKYRDHTIKKAKEWYVESKVFKGGER